MDPDFIKLRQGDPAPSTQLNPELMRAVELNSVNLWPHVPVVTIQGGIAIDRHPYRGGKIVRRHGLSSIGRHSIQIGISRAPYMGEKTLSKIPVSTFLLLA